MTSGRDWSLGRHWTPVEEVAAAARARGVLLMVWNPGNLDEHREVLVAPGGPDVVWAIRRDRREQHGGWVAVRVGLDGEDDLSTLRRLGPADASGCQVIGALVSVETPPPA